MLLITTYFDIKMILPCLLAIVAITWWLRRRPTHLPPGPWSLPFIGTLPYLAMEFYRTELPPAQVLNKIGKKYGKVFSMNIAGQLVVVLNDYKSVKEGFHDQRLSDRPASQILEEFGMSNGISLASGELWKRQHRFTLTTFRNFGVGKRSFEDSIAEEAASLTKEIELLNGKAFDPRLFFTNAMANVICSVVFGKRYEYSDASFKRLLGILHENTQILGGAALQLVFPILKYLQPSNHRKFKNNITELSAFIRGIVNNHKEEHEANNPNDYIDVYLDEIELSKKSPHEPGVNDKTLASTIIALFGAGTETSSTSLLWAVLYMMILPEVQDRIQEEIDSVVGRNRLPKLADKPELPYTWATILEIQRMATILPLGFVHSSGVDTTLGDYSIPKGSMVISNLWAIHHNPEIWQNPEEFNPGRFLDADGQLREKEELIPFSTGRRVCIGEHLAKMELYIFFTHLLHQFTFKKPGASPPLTLEGITGLVYSPKEFLTYVERRD